MRSAVNSYPSWRSPGGQSTSFGHLLVVIYLAMLVLFLMSYVPVLLMRKGLRRPSICIKVCKKRCRRPIVHHPKPIFSQWKFRFICCLLLHHDAQTFGAAATTVFHSAWATQTPSSVDIAEDLHTLMQLPGSGRSQGNLPDEFSHLEDDMVKHHFIQWETITTTALRKRGHQFRCASEFVFDTKLSKIGWFGWCTPQPPLKKFGSESVSLITDIPRWKGHQDVALDIQVREGVPAFITHYATVLRITTRISRTAFIEKLREHLASHLGLAHPIDFVFFKGRIWAEGSDVEIEVQHCDTFVIMSHREPQTPSTTPPLPAPDTALECPGEQASMDSAPRTRGVEEALDPPRSSSGTSSEEPERSLYTFLVETDTEVQRYDTVLRTDAEEDFLLDFTATFIRSNIALQEVSADSDIAVNRQRVFLVVIDEGAHFFLALQRSFYGFEKEAFQIHKAEGNLILDDYERIFLDTSPLEIFLGTTKWSSTPYRTLAPGSIVTALFPDPAGGAYRFDEEAPAISLLQIHTRSWKSLPLSAQAPGNVEDATWDLCCDSGLTLTLTPHFLDPCGNLRPPGNPFDDLEELDGLQSEQSSIARTLDEATNFGPVLTELVVVEDGGPDEEDRQSSPQEDTLIEVSLPGEMGDILRLLIPWRHQPLQLCLPPGIELLPIAQQFLFNCIAGWSDRIQTIHIFTDGSSRFNEDRQQASFAFTVFGFDPSCEPMHFFLGWFAREVALDPNDTTYTGARIANAKEAEASALLWSHIWLLQSGISKPVYFNYDALIAGNVMQGSWHVDEHWTQGLKLRELALLSQALRVGCVHVYEHCKAHSLQPCNELTDALAKHVCSDQVSNSCTEERLDFGGLFQAHDTRLSWAWWSISYYFGNEYPSRVGSSLHVCRSASEVNGHGIRSMETQRPTTTGEEQYFFLRVGTYNSMTLHSKGDDGKIVPESARAAMLRKQLADNDYHIVGLQETRCNLQTVFNSDNFVRFTSGGDPDKPGHWGCEVWFRKGLQLACTSNGTRTHFDPKLVTVLVAHPRLLAVHARIGNQSLVVVSAHAPHEGAQDDI